MKIVFVLIALLTLTGCPNTAYFEPTPLADGNKAMVYVYRPAASNPGKKPLTLSYPELMVDGKSAGFLKYKEYLALQVEPGTREFLLTGLTRDARWEPKDISYKLEVEGGKSYYLRFGVEFNTDKMSLGTFKGQYLISFYPLDPDDAVYEIRHTSKAEGQ